MPFKRSTTKRLVPFSEVLTELKTKDQGTFDFLTKFEVSHKSKGNGAKGLADKELYPFADYKIKTAPKEKRALDSGFLNKDYRIG